MASSNDDSRKIPAICVAVTTPLVRLMNNAFDLPNQRPTPSLSSVASSAPSSVVVCALCTKTRKCGRLATATDVAALTSPALTQLWAHYFTEGEALILFTENRLIGFEKQDQKPDAFSDMDYYNSLTYEQRRTLQGAATVLKVPIETLLEVPRDHPLHDIAIPSPEQVRVAPQPHSSDPLDISDFTTPCPPIWNTAVPEIAALTVGPLSGDDSWRIYSSLEAQGSLFGPSPWPNVYSNPSNIVNPWPDLFCPGTTTPSQQFNHLPLTCLPFAAGNNLEMASGLFNLCQDPSLYDDDPPFATRLHPPSNVTTTTQAPAYPNQPMTQHRVKLTTSKRTLDVPPWSRKAQGRSRYSVKRRAQTAKTREIRACMQCRQNRNRVS